MAACVPVRAQESRYVGFGNTAPPQKRDDDFLNNAMSSLYSVRTLSWGLTQVLGPLPSHQTLRVAQIPGAFSHALALVTFTVFRV